MALPWGLDVMEELDKTIEKKRVSDLGTQEYKEGKTTKVGNGRSKELGLYSTLTGQPLRAGGKRRGSGV